MNSPLDERAAELQAVVAGQLSLESELGRGGMGVVYLGRDVALDRPVAIKLLHESLANDPEARQRFLTEARTCARLVHPNIVPIFDVGEQGSLAWFVMGFVEGESLADRIQCEGPLSPDEVTKVLRDIGWALAAAHGAGVLHRDITLSNVLIENRTGRAMLLDFGLAVEFGGSDSGPLVGTPEYLAPELLQGTAPSQRSDLYSLGVAGWAMVTGHLPITGDTPGDVLLRRLQEDPVPLSQAAPGTPKPLRCAIDAALERDPERRPATMEDWLPLLDGTAVVTTTDPVLSHWVDSGALARPFYALAFSLVGMISALNEVYFVSMRLPLIGRVPMLFAMLPIAIGLGTIIHFALATVSTRRAARAGYLLTDLRVALADGIRKRIAQGTTRATLLGRLINDFAWLAGAAIVAMLLIGGIGSWWGGWYSAGLYALFSILADQLKWLWLTFFLGLGFGFILAPRDERPRSLRWRIRELFWNSPLGKLTFRIASLGVGKQIEAPNTLHRPTEVMLEVGINDLFGALPAPQRRGLEEIPVLAGNLQRKVSRIRERIALLDGAAGVRSSEAADLRERLVALRDEAIAALERLRRDLLRLGAQVATTGPLTEQLQQLRTADDLLLRALRSVP